MDPLEKGGEDSLRNVVYCCAACNGRKKAKLFTRWLLELNKPYRSISRTIYVHKHEHDPEVFVDEGYELRGGGVPLFLKMDEVEFRREFRGMLPLRDGPPAEYLRQLMRPHPGPIDIGALFLKRPT